MMHYDGSASPLVILSQPVEIGLSRGFMQKLLQELAGIHFADIA